MANILYSYQIDGTLADPSGAQTQIDGSFEVNYTAGTVGNIDISGYNSGRLSRSTAADGSAEYQVELSFFPQGLVVINTATISYNTVYPGFADAVTKTTGARPNSSGVPASSTTFSGRKVQMVARAISV